MQKKIKTKIGNLYLVEKNHKLFRINVKEIKGEPYQDTPLLNQASKQLKEYFDGKRTKFDLPLLLEGTSFQLDVYKALLKVPFGHLISYKDLASKAGHPNAYRAVGSVMHKNPLPIVVPCHRVIKNDGSIGGYGLGLNIKKTLLNTEKITNFD